MKNLEKIVESYLKSPFFKLDELDLVDEFAYLYVDHFFQLNIDPYSFEDYIIKSDTLHYVHDFLYSLNPKYALEFDQVLDSKISFLQTKKKKRIDKKDYECVASYHLQDSFDLLHLFIEYWMKEKQGVKNSDYLVETLAVLSEFLFQDYLESLGWKNKELYYPKMNRFIRMNVLTVHMLVELKLIDFYIHHSSLKQADFSKGDPNVRSSVFASFQKIIDDILESNQISIPFEQNHLYGVILACFMHQKILKQPRLIQMFCQLMDHAENMEILDFMKAIGISFEIKDEKIAFQKREYQDLRKSYLMELEDSFVKISEK